MKVVRRAVRNGFAILLFLWSCAGNRTAGPSLEVVQKHFKAFNWHDVADLTARLDTGFVWYSIDGDKVSVEVRGREQFEAGMKSYFESFPTVRSEIEEATVTGRFVVIRERVTWTQNGQEKTQSGLGVYEIEGGKILRVWYYASEE
ncbi:MAG: nuclear transport factor 2 family protein [Bacteroidota bacterium]